jgi:hypothetical protein
VGKSIRRLREQLMFSLTQQGLKNQCEKLIHTATNTSLKNIHRLIPQITFWAGLKSFHTIQAQL